MGEAGKGRLAAIGLGSNLASGFGDREANLWEAVRRVGALGRVEAVSSFYDTAPVGYVEQPRFLNGAMLLETELAPLEVMRGMLAVEREMGRVRGVAKGPRVIDLDLLLYGDVVMVTDELVLPHPEMERRGFVLEPLAEIAAAMVHPVLGVTVGDLKRRGLPAGPTARGAVTS
ncbi:MAG: 2-amino-4-hydroxy-6-hydroxymethyldihydropteridine diphosphokinase [Acidobacteriota bacterium]|nr:2-amino-4-hydroxy-6-hydroxymethyldihydropteridine diphosphokinase [Acidobacteriota bacterium]